MKLSKRILALCLKRKSKMVKTKSRCVKTALQHAVIIAIMYSNSRYIQVFAVI